MDVTKELEDEINARLVLIFTGQPRLAKNLLQVKGSFERQSGGGWGGKREFTVRVLHRKQFIREKCFGNNSILTSIPILFEFFYNSHEI